MRKKGGYSGGSTVIHGGSGWFSKPDPNINPETGETRAEHIRRLAAEAKLRKQQQEKSKKARNLEKAKKTPKLQRPQPDLGREERVARQRAEAEERLSKVTVERIKKKMIKKPKS